MAKFLLAIAVLVGLTAQAALAQDEPNSVVITNVSVWDGVSDAPHPGMSVRIDGNLITKVSANRITVEGATVIDGQGGTLMPGLIDMHTHVMFKYGVNPSRPDIDHAAAGAMALETMQLYMSMGYTTLRDVGGNSLGLARAIARGQVSAPRLYSSGSQISGISGHADLGTLNESPGEDVFARRGDGTAVVGPVAVREAVLTNLRGGATHIKVMPGGGVASDFDPLPLVPQDLVVRKRWFSDVEILRQNTSHAARWLAKSGPKNPYKDGPLGVIQNGAYADLLIVDGDPTKDVSILADYETTIRLILKNGKVFRNDL